MRFSRLALAVVVVVVAACSDSSSPASVTSVPGALTTTPGTSADTSSLPTQPPTTRLVPTSSITTTTTDGSTTSTTAVTAGAGPDYVVAASSGVFRVTDGVATLVVDRTDVMWASDDGMGGIVYYVEPGNIEHLPADSTTPTVLATYAMTPTTFIWPRFVTLIDGTPTLATSERRPGDCDDADNSHVALIDLTTGEHRIQVPCIPLESWGIHPASSGGNLSVSVAGGGWPDAEPPSARLVFRPVDLPESITSLTDWDGEAMQLLDSLEIEVPGNPWPETCYWCTLDPRLSRDGTTLAIIELTPEPVDLGAGDWDEFDALDLRERWRRWDDLWNTATRQLRIVDLNTGEAVYSELVAGSAWVTDFDGRYTIFESVEAGQFPPTAHLVDTMAGEHIPIDWGITDPARSGSITLVVR